MKTIGIGDIQKNTSIFYNLTEAIEIVDERNKKTVAVIYPVRENSIVAHLAGKYRDKKSAPADLTLAKEAAMAQAMKEK
jgi:hypothetical protein